MRQLTSIGEYLDDLVAKHQYDGHDLGNVFILAARLEEAAATERDIRIRLILQKAHCLVRDAHHAAIEGQHDIAGAMLSVSRWWVDKVRRA